MNNRRTTSEHLAAGKDELGRIFAEKVLRERAQIEACDVAMTYVELLIESSQLFEHVRDFAGAAPDIQESVASLVYSAQRMSIPELYVAAGLLRDHFGASVIDPIASGDDGPYLRCVNTILSVKLDTAAPDAALVREEMIHIANEFDVDWTAPHDTYSGGMAQSAYNPHSFPPQPPPGGENPSAPLQPPPPCDYYGGGGGGGGGGMPNFVADSIPGYYGPGGYPQGPMIPPMPSAPQSDAPPPPPPPMFPAAPSAPSAPFDQGPPTGFNPSYHPPPAFDADQDDDLTARLNRLRGGGGQ